MKNYHAQIEYFKKQAGKPMLEKLLSEKVYENTLAELRQLAVDKGYTEEWLKEQIVQLNKQYLELVEKELEVYNVSINKLEEQYQKIANTGFEHNFTATDYADLQFLQTLIKTRIVNESQKQQYLTERILKDYISTQKGARAIMFLANDSEIGEQIKPFYNTASANSLSPAEKRFNTEKQTELDKLGSVITQMTQTAIVGSANVRAARERVQADDVAKVNSIYFQ